MDRIRRRGKAEKDLEIFILALAVGEEIALGVVVDGSQWREERGGEGPEICRFVHQ
jgi:hypothetical protein